MRKLLLCMVVFSMIFSFSSPVNAEEHTIVIRGKIDHSNDGSMERVNSTPDEKSRYLEIMEKRAAKHAQFLMLNNRPGTDSTNAADVDLDSSSFYFQPDVVGDTMMTGFVMNNGNGNAVYVKVSVLYYNILDQLIGYGYGYCWGGSNVKTPAGFYTNQMGPGDPGFFKVYSYADYTRTWSYLATITWSTYNCSAAQANVALNGSVTGYNDGGYQALSGSLINNSTNYMSYNTTIAFGLMNLDKDKIIDVKYTEINGSTYGTDTSALNPGQSGTFDTTAYYARYYDTSNTFWYAIEWDEVKVSNMQEADPPFGTLDTPVDGSTVASSIAVTGWALDDGGINRVEVHIDVGGGTLVYLGDANLVEGARPDVAAAFPDHPGNTKAGYGYMLLTNFLPNQGNGTFVVHTIAVDNAGKSTTLGTKTIICDNANAKKPFGAIDTPTQGGTVAGDSVKNQGWVLTPQPNSIPTDGSTIKVLVDGKYKGTVIYNLPRTDIANYFPGYANATNAAGYFMLDTTEYTDGVYTIQWTARDTGGNSDGIGSRFFSIKNARQANQANFKRSLHKPFNPDRSRLSSVRTDFSMPIQVRHGYEDNVPAMEISPDASGVSCIGMNEDGRIVVNLTRNPANGYTYHGYMVYKDKVMPLPIGSTLDADTGIFYWVAGPGFIGDYNLVFVQSGPNGAMSKKNVKVTVLPKGGLMPKFNLEK